MKRTIVCVIAFFALSTAPARFNQYHAQAQPQNVATGICQGEDPPPWCKPPK